MNYSRVESNLIEITGAFEEMRASSKTMKEALDEFDFDIWKEQFVQYANDYEIDRKRKDWLDPDAGWLKNAREYGKERIRTYLRMSPPRHRDEDDFSMYTIRIEEKRISAITVRADCFDNAINRAEEAYLDGKVEFGKPESVMFTGA